MKSEDSSGLRIDVRQTEGVIILDLTGELALGPGHWRLWEKASALAGAGVKNVILNLRGVSKIDAAGAGELTLLLTRARAVGIRVALLNLSASTIDPTDVFQFVTECEAFEDERDAINAFFPNRRVKRYDILSFVVREASERGEADKLAGVTSEASKSTV